MWVQDPPKFENLVKNVDLSCFPGLILSSSPLLFISSPSPSSLSFLISSCPSLPCLSNPHLPFPFLLLPLSFLYFVIFPFFLPFLLSFLFCFFNPALRPPDPSFPIPFTTEQWVLGGRVLSVLQRLSDAYVL